MKFLLSLLACCALGTAIAKDVPPPPQRQLLIQHVDDATPTTGKRVEGLKDNTRVIVLPKGESPADAIAKAAKDPTVKNVEEDKRLPLDGTPNDPSFPNQYHLFKTKANAAWDTSTGQGVIIAILDSGVLSSHPDLINNIVPGWNVFNNNANTADVSRHGTAVAGTAGAVGNNLQGIASTAYGAKIMPVRVTDDTGYAYYSTVAKGLIWAADNGARVANISIAGAASSSTINNAAGYFKSKGGVVIIAAGNDGKLQNLTTATNSIVVAATDANDAWQSYSNYGDHITVAAPGQSIITTNREGGYNAWSKTSFSAPQVAGLVALIMSTNPKLTPDEIQSIIQASAVDLGTPGKDPYYGYGRIDAEQAVKLAKGSVPPLPPADTTPPVVTLSSTASGPVSGTIEVSVNAIDKVGVKNAGLLINGSLYGTLTTPPYVFTINTTTLTNGDAAIQGTATDEAGNTGQSPITNLTVFNDKTAPVINVVSPTNGSTITNMAAITLASTATDNMGTAGITQTVVVDGTIKKTVVGGSLSYRWYLSGVPSGSHTITFTAKDAAGNVSATTVTVVK